MARARIEVLPNPSKACRRAAEEFCRAARSAVRRRGRFDVALAGGTTPRALYELLSNRSLGFRDRVAWKQVHVFWGDERHVPPDDPQSNFRMAWSALLSRVPIPAQNVHRVPAELGEPERAASVYERMLTEHFKGVPRFDLILLGLGDDGHTASLFPRSAALSERRRAVRANWSPSKRNWRITLTFPAIDRAHEVVFLVCGAEKAHAVRLAIAGDARVPAARLRPPGTMLWILDRAAAAELD